MICSVCTSHFGADAANHLQIPDTRAYSYMSLRCFDLTMMTIRFVWYGPREGGLGRVLPRSFLHPWERLREHSYRLRGTARSGANLVSCISRTARQYRKPLLIATVEKSLSWMVWLSRCAGPPPSPRMRPSRLISAVLNPPNGHEHGTCPSVTVCAHLAFQNNALSSTHVLLTQTVIPHFRRTILGFLVHLTADQELIETRRCLQVKLGRVYHENPPQRQQLGSMQQGGTYGRGAMGNMGMSMGAGRWGGLPSVIRLKVYLFR